MNNLRLWRRARRTIGERSALLVLSFAIIAVIATTLILAPRLLASAWPIWESARAPRTLNLETIDWTGVAAIAALGALLINLLLLASVWFGFRSVKEGQAARSADVLFWAMKQMDEIKGDQRAIRKASPDPASWDEETVQAAVRLCNAYQRMCYFVRKKLIDQNHFRDIWGVNICIYWRILKPFVYAERKKFDDKQTAYEGAYIRADFEFIADTFQRYFNRRNPHLLAAYERNSGQPKPVETQT